MNLKDKVVVITGSTGGIGREIVKRMDDEGARLVLVSKSQDELETQIKSLKRKDNEYFACDFSNQEEMDKVSKEIAGKYTSINVLLNCAGIGIYKPVEEATIEEWNLSMNIGMNSVFIFCRNLLPIMGESEDSLVLSIGSGDGVIPVAGRSLYCTMKFALRGFMLSLAEEYKRIGKPKFVLITLGSTLTSFGPMSMEEKRKEMESGKAYFTPEWVGNRLTEIVKEGGKQVEYELFPSGYEG